MKSWIERLGAAVIPRLAWSYLCFVGWTSRIVWLHTEDRDAAIRKHGNIIFAFWHGRQFFLPWAYKNTGHYVLVSRSRDGELIARVIELAGMGTVRGSSSRGGAQAVLELKSKLDDGYTIGITPDGPRGPKRTVHDGVLFLARETGTPVVPVAASFSRRLVFRGWDDYWVPLPFNKIVINHGKAIQISRSDSPDEKSMEIKDAVDRVTDGADETAESMAGGTAEALIYFVYNLALFIFFPLILLGLALKHPRTFWDHFWDGFEERLGRYPALSQSGGETVWIHAASLGECRAALPFVAALRREKPALRIIFSSTTINGVTEARRLHLGDTVVFSPLDMSHSVAQALAAFRPRMLLLLESEIWPNWLRAAKNSGATVGILNGRVSERSARRYKLFRRLCRPWMGKIDFVCAREEADAGRFAQIGISKDRIVISGNLKYDLFPWNLNGSGKTEAGWKKGSRPQWVAGSVREGEVSLVLDAYFEARKSVEDLQLVIAPRHLENMAEIETRARAGGLSALRRTEKSKPRWDILIWDTFGDLWQAYREADAAFVGGSLLPFGGQNPIEPASFEKPVIFGPYMENFNEPALALLESGGAVRVRDARELAETIVKIMSDERLRKDLGKKAKGSVDKISGRATRACIEKCLKFL